MQLPKESLPLRPFQETLGASMCGPASLLIALDYWGISKTERELAEICGTSNNIGTSDAGLKRAAERLGFKADIRNFSSLNDIAGWLRRGISVIVDWFTRGRSDCPDSEVADGHYSVVAGLDETHIYLQDPEIGGMRIFTRADFLKVWFDFAGDHITSWEDMIVRQIIAIYPDDGSSITESLMRS
jgi:predicted double-glycine peptidase